MKYQLYTRLQFLHNLRRYPSALAVVVVRRCLELYLLLLSFTLHAQTPQAFNYQAVCRDTMGTPLSNQVVRYRTSILQSSPSGTILYQETHSDTTNVYGISTLQIGKGTTVQGTFASIPWVSGSYYLSIEIDPAGGNNFRSLGTPELLSVPYALFSSDGLANGTQPNQLVYWNGTAWDTLNPGNPGQMLTLCNGSLIWGTCPGTITSLDCSNAQHSGTLIEGVAAVQISSTIAYTGGNGGIHAGQTIASTGVSGLIATCTSGYFGNGSGTVTYSITGTPVGNGTAIFAINIGGQNCILNRTVIVNHWRSGMVHCGVPTQVVPVTNPTTGKIWMDRNLGASQVATSSTDANAYGDLYQWGRFGDGHQCRNSGTTATLSSTDTPGHGNFITTSGGNYDWRSPQNNNLWQGVNGINNPCPTGYRLPTDSEWDAERISWSANNSSGAFASPLKLLMGGGRDIDGSLLYVGSHGDYWSATVSGIVARNFYFTSANASLSTNFRGLGLSVRCLQD